MHSRFLAGVAVLVTFGCTRPAVPARPPAARPVPAVVAAEGVLADFARQVAGGRAAVESIVPAGMDAHSYEPAPGDIAAAARARLVITNGAGLERFMDALMSRAGEDTLVVEASRGLQPLVAADGGLEPHLWLDPVMAIRYVQNIRDAFSRIDPSGELAYGANGDAYIRQLRDLDAWITDQISAVPPERRKAASSQEEIQYFAERYGIQFVHSADAPALPWIDSLTGPSGDAPTYIEMMRYDVKVIVAAMTGG